MVALIVVFVVVAAVVAPQLRVVAVLFVQLTNFELLQ